MANLSEKLVQQEIKVGNAEEKKIKQLPEEKVEKSALCEKHSYLKPQNTKRLLGLSCALLSGFCYSLISLFIKFITEINPLQLAFIGLLGLLIPSSIILLWERRSPWPKEKHFQIVLRGVLGTASFITGNMAIRFLPLGDASVIIFSAPIFVTVLARLILKESFTIFHIVLNFVTLTGVTLIARPPFLFGGHTYDSQDSIIGIFVALVNVLIFAGLYITMRTLADIHYAVSIFHFSIIGTVICGTLSWHFGTFTFTATTNHQLFMLALAVFNFLGQYLLTKALQFEDAGPVSMMRSIDIVFAFIWQYLFLSVAPGILSVGGASLVILSVILMGLRKVVEGAADDSSTAKYCKCLMV